MSKKGASRVAQLAARHCDALLRAGVKAFSLISLLTLRFYIEFIFLCKKDVTRRYWCCSWTTCFCNSSLYYWFENKNKNMIVYCRLVVSIASCKRCVWSVLCQTSCQVINKLWFDFSSLICCSSHFRRLLLGRSARFAVLDSIFSDFCLKLIFLYFQSDDAERQMVSRLKTEVKKIDFLFVCFEIQ